MHSRKTFRLSIKLFLISISILLAALLLENAFMYQNSYRLVEESLNLSAQSIVQNHAKNIDDFFQRTDTIRELMIMEIPSQLPSLRADSDDFYAQYWAYGQLRDKFTTLLNTAIGQDIRYRAYLFLHMDYPLVRFLISPQNDFLEDSVRSAPNSSFTITGEKMLTDQSWYRSTLENAGSSFWFMHPNNPDTIWIACSLEGNFLINSAVEHHTLGIFLIGIDVSWITDQLDLNFKDGNSLLFITDSANRIIYARDTSLLDQNIDFLLAGQETAYHAWESSLADKIHLYLLVPESSFNNQIRAALNTILWLLLFILCASTLLFAVYSRFITRPIRQLSAHMETHASPTPIADYHSGDEIGVLYRSFNEMVEKQQELIQQIYHYSEEQKQLKYQMLQAQINPHFLYNTLDSVGCAALMEGNGNLTDILSSLAALLRYSISQPDHLVTLREELQVADDYIRIQQFRYDGLLLYVCDVPEAALRASMPKSIIQPLVENCIMYGHVQPGGYHRLSLSAHLDTENDSISILLYNDISPGQQESDYAGLLNRYLHGGCRLERNSSGLGILNVQQRIEFVFGKGYGLHYEQAGERLVTVVSLPFFE